MRIVAALDSPSDHSSSPALDSIEDDSAVRDNLLVVGLRSPSSNVNAAARLADIARVPSDFFVTMLLLSDGPGVYAAVRKRPRTRQQRTSVTGGTTLHPHVLLVLTRTYRDQ